MGRVRRPAPSFTSARFAKLKLSGRTKAPASPDAHSSPRDTVGSMSYDWPMMVMKWRALSLKHLAYFDDLKRTGRWQHHFATEDAFEGALRKASADAEKWKQLADGYDRLTRQTGVN